MKTICLFLGIVTAPILFSCQKVCEKPSVEPPADCSAWSKSWGGSHEDQLKTGVKTADGGYIAVGYSKSNDGDMIGSQGDYDILVVKTDAKGNKVWQKLLGTADSDVGRDIVAASDGGYIVLGYKADNAGDVLIIKIDEQGNQVWHKIIGGGGSAFQGAWSIVATNNGYAIAGENTQGNSFFDTWVFKVDLQGNVVWEKIISHSSYNDLSNSIISTADGGFLVSGSTVEKDNFAAYNGLLTKLDASGNLVWQKEFGGSGNDYLYDIVPGLDGGYILVGETNSNDGDMSGMNHSSSSTSDLLIVKVDANGNKQWVKLFGGSEEDSGLEIVSTKDGHYMVSGSTSSTNGDITGNHGANDGWLLKLNPSGNKVSQKVLGGSGNDYGFGIIATDCGSILLGSSFSNNGDLSTNRGADDAWMIKTSF